MTRTFKYGFNDGRILLLNLEVKYNGIVTNTYMPEFLSPGYPLFCQGVNIQDPAVFDEDCALMVDYFNTVSNKLDYGKLDDWFQVLAAVVRNHINNHNRIFFSDVKTYMDDIALLMRAAGFDEGTVKMCYPRFVLWIVENYKDNVKEGIPGVGIIPFINTNIYRTLLEKCGQ